MGEGLRCRFLAALELALRDGAGFDLRCFADLLDTAQPSVGRSACAQWRSPAARLAAASWFVGYEPPGQLLRALALWTAGNPGLGPSRTVGCRSPECTS